jgi:hypothetical protein
MLLFKDYNFNAKTNFSIRIVCKSWLKYFSEILFVGVTLTYTTTYDRKYEIFYEGDWKNLKKEGRGMFIQHSYEHTIYIGEFKNNKRNGKGTYYFNGRKEYEGEWKDGMKEGFGISFSRVDGSIDFKGNWKRDQKNIYRF